MTSSSSLLAAAIVTLSFFQLAGCGDDAGALGPATGASDTAGATGGGGDAVGDPGDGGATGDTRSNPGDHGATTGGDGGPGDGGPGDGGPTAGEDGATPPTKVTITFVEPTNGAAVAGLVSISVKASSFAGIAEVVVLTPAGLTDQRPAEADWFEALWDTSVLADGPVTIEARATASDGTEAAAAISVTVSNEAVGEVSGIAALAAPLGNLTVSVATFDGLVVGKPIGGGTTAPDGSFQLGISPPEPNGRVLIQVGDDLVRATALLEDGVATQIAVTGLSALALDLAGRYHIDGMGAEEAELVARVRLNEHLQRPGPAMACSATPAMGQAGTAEGLSGLFHAGLEALAEAEGETAETLLNALRTDLGDGLFDGLVAGELLAAEYGYVLSADTTRLELAAATWGLLSGADPPGPIDLPALAEPGGYFEDVSLDKGVLYPPDAEPSLFDPYPPEIAFVDPTPPAGFVAEPIDVSVSGSDNGAFAIVFTSPPGVELIGAGGLLSHTFEPAEWGDGELVVTAQASDNAENTAEVSRTFHIDTTGPVVAFTSPAVGAVLSEPSFGVTGTALDAGVGAEVISFYFGDTEFYTTAVEADGSWILPSFAGKGPTTIIARATDALGNEGEPASLSFVVDIAGPVVTIDTPAGDGIVAEPTLVVAGTAADDQHAVAWVMVTVNGAETAATVADDGSWSADLALQSASNEIAAFGVDELGNTGLPASSVVILLDQDGPELTIDAPTPGTFAGVEEPTWVTGTATDAPAGVAGVTVTVGAAAPVEATVDGGAWTTQAGPFAIEQDGETVAIDASATDALGNTSAAGTTVVVDGQGPTLALVSAPAWTADSKATIVASAMDGDGSGVVGVEASTPTGAVQALEPTETSGEWSTEVDLEAPSSAFTLEAWDAVGNHSLALEVTIQIDDSPPELSVDPFDGPGGGSKNFYTHLQSPTYTFTGTATDGGSGVAQVLLSCNDGQVIEASTVEQLPAATATWTATWAFDVVMPEKTCQVQAFDQVSHVAKAVVVVVVDSVPPEVAVAFPAPQSWVGAGDLQIGGTVSDLFSGVAAVTASVGGQELVGNVVGGVWNATVQAPAAHGEFVVDVVAKDAVGNQTLLPHPLRVDAMAPTATFFFLPESGKWYTSNSGVTYIAALSTPLKCGGVDAETGSISACLQADDAPPFCSESGAVQTTVMTPPTGAALTCATTDPFGNSASTQMSIIGDVDGPKLTVTTPEDGLWTGNATIDFTGTVTDATDGPIMVTVTPHNGDPQTTTATAEGTWSLAATAAKIGHQFTIEAVDALGNKTKVFQTVNYDSNGPTITWLESTYVDELDMPVDLGPGGVPYYGSGKVQALGPSCVGSCLVRKYISRGHFSNPADIEANNLPVLRLDISDDGSALKDIDVRFRFLSDKGVALTAWLSFEDADDGQTDQTLSIPWAVETLSTIDPAIFQFGNAHETTGMEVRATDAYGNETNKTLVFQTELLTPPPIVTHIELPAPDGTDLSAFTMDGGNWAEPFQKGNDLAKAGGVRLAVHLVTNPYDFDLRLVVGGGQVTVKASVYRPYLATGGAGKCAASSGCGFGTCHEPWTEPAGCGEIAIATPHPIENPNPHYLDTEVTDSQGNPVDQVQTVYYPLAAGETVTVTTRVNLFGECNIGAPTEVTWLEPASGPDHTKTTVFPWADSCTEQAAGVPVGECWTTGPCVSQLFKAVGDYHRPLVTLSTTVQSTNPWLVKVVSHDWQYKFNATSLTTKPLIYETSSDTGAGLPTLPYSTFF